MPTTVPMAAPDQAAQGEPMHESAGNIEITRADKPQNLDHLRIRRQRRLRRQRDQPRHRTTDQQERQNPQETQPLRRRNQGSRQRV